LELGPFFEEEHESECPEEDGCEIVWDKMPQPPQEVQNAANPLDCEDEGECEIDWDAMPDAAQEADIKPVEEGKTCTSIADVQEEKYWEKGRMKLEMNWQIDECQADKDSCEEFCQDCAGSGKASCRFCNGAGMLAFGNDIRACNMCHDGIEECTSCRGTGKIAPWVTTFLDVNKMP